jgi:hypothetical protein
LVLLNNLWTSLATCKPTIRLPPSRISYKLTGTS